MFGTSIIFYAPMKVQLFHFILLILLQYASEYIRQSSLYFCRIFVHSKLDLKKMCYSKSLIARKIMCTLKNIYLFVHYSLIFAALEENHDNRLFQELEMVKRPPLMWI